MATIKKSLLLSFVLLLALLTLSLLSTHLYLHSSSTPLLLLLPESTAANLTFILYSDIAPSFRLRLHDFLTPCPSHFFMTWISPAHLFHNREILSILTLFQSHPHSCLVLLSQTLDSDLGSRILSPITDLGFKILLVSPDIPFLLQNTPALNWYNRALTGEIDLGQIPFSQNLSNLLRLAVLYKYGGVYLDTDFIILRNFEHLRNSIGAQSVNAETGEWARLNNAALIFDKGHPILLKMIEEFVIGFDGNRWGHNGPYLVSRVIRGGTGEGNITVLPPRAFYPLGWTRLGGLFMRPNTKAHKKWAKLKVAQLKGGSTYGAHLWNKQSGGMKIEEGSVIWRLVNDTCVCCKNIFISSAQ